MCLSVIWGRRNTSRGLPLNVNLIGSAGMVMVLCDGVEDGKRSNTIGNILHFKCLITIGVFIIEPRVGVMRGLADRVIAMTCRNWSYLILSLGKEGGCYCPYVTKPLYDCRMT